MELNKTKTSSDQRPLKIINNLLRWSFCFLFFVLPLFFWPQLFSSFTIAKTVLFRLSTAFVWCLLALKIYYKKTVTFPSPGRATLIAFGGYLLSVFLATIFSSSPFLSFFGGYEHQQGALQTLFYLFFFLAALIYFTEEKDNLKKVLKAALYGAIIVSLIAIFQKFSPYLNSFWHTEDFLGRQGSTLGHPNFLAAYLVLLFPFFFAFREKSWRWLSLVILTALFFTGSRAGAMALLVEIIVMAIVFLQSHREKIAIVICSLIFLAAIIFFRLQLSENFSRSMESRFLTWKATIQMIANRPLFGYGPEMFQNSFMQYTPPELLKSEKFSTLTDRAHNEILDSAVNTGIVGTLFYLIFLFFIIKTGLRGNQPDYALRRISQSSAIAISGLFTANLFSFSVTTHLVFFWFFAAIILVINNKASEKKIPHVLAIALVILAIPAIKFSINQFLADIEYKKAMLKILEPASFETIEHFKKAVSINPYESRYPIIGAEFSLFKAEDSEGQVKKEYLQDAKEFLSAIQKMNENLYLQAILFRNKNENRQSLNVFAELKKKAPYNPKYILEHARTFRKIGDHKSALERYNFYISLTPAPDRLFLKHNPDFPQILKEIEEIRTL